MFEKIIIAMILGVIGGIAIQESTQNVNFKKCVKQGGKIKTQSINKFFYREICVLGDKIVKGGMKIGKPKKEPEKF